jgi:hypothetical protein
MKRFRRIDSSNARNAARPTGWPYNDPRFTKILDRERQERLAEEMRQYLLSGGRIWGLNVVRITDYKARKARQAILESAALALKHPSERDAL